MSRWLVLPLVVLPYIATAASGAVPRDRDHDGLPDGWERRHHLSTSKRSATGDPDRDGLANKREYRLRTNPHTRILGNGGFLIRSNSTGLLVEDSELVTIDSSNAPNCWAGIGFDGYTVRRSEIVGCENGVDPASNAVIEDSYIHDLDTVGPGWVLNPPHTDGVQMGDGAHDVVVRHNTIDPVAGSGGGTAAIIAYAAGDRVRIEDNFIDGGGSSYAIYAPRNPRTAWFINRNRMLPGVYGYTACVKVGTMVTELTENRDFGTHALLGPDNGVGGGCTN